MSVFRWSYRIAALVLLTYALVYGLLAELPRVASPGMDLGQTSRNLFFHVPMWFSMYLMMFLSFVWSVVHLKTQRPEDDERARSFAGVGIVFGLLGLTTGILWSRVTWGGLMPDDNPGAWWAWDPRQTGALTAVLAYMAYFVLRSNLEEPTKRSRLAAVYNIFAGVSLVPLTYVIPKMLGVLHPGDGEGSGDLFPAGSVQDSYRLIFYPAVIGFMCLGLWMVDIRTRIARLERLRLDQ